MTVNRRLNLRIGEQIESVVQPSWVQNVHSGWFVGYPSLKREVKREVT
jgi:hypothetical protein